MPSASVWPPGAQHALPVSLARTSASALTTYTSHGSLPGPCTHTLSWEAGLIQSDRRGTWVYYRIVPAGLASLARAFSPDGNHGR